MPDGTSNTIAIGEVSVMWNGTYLDSDGADWVRGIGTSVNGNGMSSCRNVSYPLNTPYNGVYNDIAFSSRHTNLVQFAYADGSVRTLPVSTSLAVLQAVASRNGGEAEAAP